MNFFSVFENIDSMLVCLLSMLSSLFLIEWHSVALKLNMFVHSCVLKQLLISKDFQLLYGGGFMLLGLYQY